MADAQSEPLVTIILPLTASLVSLFVLAQVGTTYTTAYQAAPIEITTFIDAVDFSIQENESYERDVGKLARLEDKVRLGRLLREIQRCGDDLREELNKLLVDEGGTQIRFGARWLWATKRKRLEQRVSRLDLMRMRFLVVYMGIVAGKETKHREIKEEKKAPPRMHIPPPPGRPPMPHMITEGQLWKTPSPKTPVRRLATQALGHNEAVGTPQRTGWAGVVHELQNSPVMQKRRASVESSINSMSYGTISN